MTIITTYGTLRSYTVFGGVESNVTISPQTTVVVDGTPSAKRRKPLDLIRNMSSYSHEKSVRVDDLYPKYSGTQFIGMGLVSSQAALGFDGRASSANSRTIDLSNQLRSQIKGKGVNLAQAMAEYAQTASTFASVAARAANLTRAIVTRNPRLLSPRGGWSKATANAWLEYQYGIKPAMSDLSGAYDALKNRSKSLEPSVTIRARHREQETYLSSSGGVSYSDSYTREDKATAIVFYNNLTLLQSLGQFGFTNPAALAWELIPFSFVVDWFLSIGDFLASLDNCLYVSQIYAFQTKRFNYMRSAAFRATTGSYLYRQTTRSVFQLSPISTIQYKPSSSLTHILNGLALLRQVRH